MTFFKWPHVLTFLTHSVAQSGVKRLLLRQDEDSEAALQHPLPDRKTSTVRPGSAPGNFPEPELVDQLATQGVQITDTPLNMMDVAGHLGPFFLLFSFWT
jgi:hypothetical protein